MQAVVVRVPRREARTAACISVLRRNVEGRNLMYLSAASPAASRSHPGTRNGDAMMACDTGYDSGMYAALAFMLLAIAVWSQCACDWGTDECSSDEDEAPEGMFT